MLSAKELLAEAERLQRQTQFVADTQRIQDEHSASSRTRREIGIVLRFLYQAGMALRWLWGYLAPVRRGVRRVLYWIWLGYLWLWNRLTFTTSSVGVRVFSPVRGGLMLVVTVMFSWLLIFPLLEFSFDAPTYLLTAKINESVYLKGSQEIDARISTHAIKGCHKVPCDDQDAIYFRVENDLMSTLWSLLHGRGLFFPEYVAAAG